MAVAILAGDFVGTTGKAFDGEAEHPFNCRCMSRCLSKPSALVQRNPDLEVLHLTYMRMTSASLVSVSRLTRLQELVIMGSVWDSIHYYNFSVEAILTLLRGPSRHVLRLLEISCEPFDLDAVAQEVQLMQQERREKSGRSREVISLFRKTGNSFHFYIRASRV